MTLSFRQRVVIVSGAAQGNGRAIADGFLAAGATVYYLDSQERITRIARGKRTRRARAVVCDLLDEQAVVLAVREIAKREGRIDVLVNNAGISLSDPGPYSTAVWDRTIAVNLKGTFLLSREVIGVMARRKSGAVVNITSLGGRLGFPDNPSYQASKGGVRQLTRALARDWAKFNIRVNSVCPGYIRTSMTVRSFRNAALRAERSKRMLLPRWGEPRDLVGPCLFLASDAAAYVTGIEIPVDGGWLANGL